MKSQPITRYKGFDIDKMENGFRFDKDLTLEKLELEKGETLAVSTDEDGRVILLKVNKAVWIDTPESLALKNRIDKEMYESRVFSHMLEFG